MKRTKNTASQYQPSQKILENYAKVLVNYALGGGKGIKKGDVVIVQAPESAKPLYIERLRAIWRSGGHAISRFSLDSGPADKDFFLLAEDHQLDFFPDKFMKGMIDQADHILFVIAEKDKKSLAGIHPSKIMKRERAFKPYMEWRNEKENKGKFTWTIGLYGTEAMAHEAGISLKEYWQQISEACFLEAADPVAMWRKISKQIEQVKNKLNKLPIEKVHIEGPDVDLWIKLGDKRAWAGGGGRNIPSFEIFTSPDWRGTEGWIKFNQPLYRYGNLIEGIELEFKNGVVTKSKAAKNYAVLENMLKSPNGNKVGEFSLTDGRVSHITKFMAETLYDENVGGKEGNTHIALGNAYHDCYAGNPANVSKKEWSRLGYNDSAVHSDIVSTAPRTVTAYLKNGNEKIIYKNGNFTV
jgi:aminopeptidase